MLLVALLALTLFLIKWFFNSLQKTIDKNSASRIQKLARQDYHSAVEERRRLRTRRRVIKTVHHMLFSIIAVSAGSYVIYLAVYGKILDRFSGYSMLVLLIIGIAFLTLAAKSIKTMREKGASNISFVETSDVIESGVKFALYLRAFKSDSRRSFFNEEILAKFLFSKNILMVGVGLPEEVDAPRGAVRVYVGNDMWQDEVHLLMEYASYVYLRICNTKPCLWEVEQVLASKNDIYIIVDDFQEYRTVRAKFPQLPAISELRDFEYVIYRRVGKTEWENVTDSWIKRDPREYDSFPE